MTFDDRSVVHRGVGSLDLRDAGVLQRCEAVPRRARVEGA